MCGECKIFRVQLHVNGNLLTVTAFCLSNIFMAHSGAVAVLHKNKKNTTTTPNWFFVNIIWPAFALTSIIYIYMNIYNICISFFAHNLTFLLKIIEKPSLRWRVGSRGNSGDEIDRQQRFVSILFVASASVIKILIILFGEFACAPTTGQATKKAAKQPSSLQLTLANT